MALYSYRARDSAGKVVKGTMEAADKTELIDKLHKMGYMTTNVRESSGRAASSVLDSFSWIRSDDILVFYVQLANMISAGITILMSLNTLAKQTENKALKQAIGNVSRQVEAGASLSQAFASQPRIFSKLFVNMIKAGEASGNLDSVLMRYAQFFENQNELKQKINSALFYPVILLCAGLAVTLFIITFVIPQFAEIYLKAGIKLPLPTLIVYNAGIAIKKFWYLGIIAFIALFIGIRLYIKLDAGRLLFDRMKLTLPIVGSLYRKVVMARFSRTLATLLGSGVPILQSLDITREVVGNEVIARAVSNIRGYVEKGERMSEPMRVSEEFPPDIVQMVAVGEETGNVDGMLNKTADFYDITVEYAVKRLTTIIEPLFLVILGIMVGFIMASMLMPIFDMVKTLRH
ncbi:MAG: type II secretion system F family protein [Candidatus Omnitrophota bacterium]